ncbi:MAG: CoA transferase subunit A [Candidatus Syntropharchaeia archaeon]
MKEKVFTIEEAVELIKDGDTVAIGGSTVNMNPVAVVHEIIRKKIKNLRLMGVVPGYSFDILIGAGCVSGVELALLSFEGIGFPRCFDRAMREGKISVEDYSNYAIASRFRAGAAGVPFFPIRSMFGSDLMKYSKAREISCPFTGEKVCVVPAANPDVGIIHAQKGDRFGNIQILGASLVDPEIAKSAKKTIVTVEKIVENNEIRKNPHLTAVTYLDVTAVVEVPLGAYPTSCYTMYNYDRKHLEEYIDASRSDESMGKYLEKYVFGVSSHAKFVEVSTSKDFSRIDLHR